MSIELTDQKRYELEKDTMIGLLLRDARIGRETTAESLAFTLGIDIKTVERLEIDLKTDGIIK